MRRPFVLARLHVHDFFGSDIFERAQFGRSSFARSEMHESILSSSLPNMRDCEESEVRSIKSI